MASRRIIVFYAWQSDSPSNINRNFIRLSLDDAAKRLTDDKSVDAEVVIDADTEGVVGTPPVTETILKKIAACDIFAPDLTFIAKTEGGKFIPNPNVMIEYGYALRALSFEAMMPVMNTHFGPPEKLPFDLGHVRHPTQYLLAPDVADGERRKLRESFSITLEDILRVMVKHALNKQRSDTRFASHVPVRPPAFFFQPQEVLANFGSPGEQELRFKRDRAIYMRLHPTYGDQPRIGLTKIVSVAKKLMPLERIINSPSVQNNWGAINLQPHGEGITSFTQAFETGELWGASEQPFRSSGNTPFVAAIAVERAFVTPLENYRMIYEQELKLRPPFTIEFGAIGLKDLSLLVPSAEFPSIGDFAGPFRKNSLSFKTELSSFDKSEWLAALRQFFILLYDLAVRDRSKVLTDDIIAANELPPR